MEQNFREHLKELRRMTEMPKYTNHDFLDFKPIDDKSMQFLEAMWDEIPVYSYKTQSIYKDVKCFVNKRKTMAIIGLTYWEDGYQSWHLEIASYVKLEKTSYDYYKVIGVYTKEDLRGSKYSANLYYSLIKSGVLLCSDNEQYKGAKPLWKTISRVVKTEIYNEETKETFDYSEHTIDDDKVWSTDDTKFDVVLRVKK